MLGAKSLPQPDFVLGGGEMGAAIRDHDWQSSLGAPPTWPIQLKTLVEVMLSSRQPMFIAWGSKRIWFNNDAFTPILGDKHPGALGRPAMEVWAEARDVLEPLFGRVFAGEPVHMEDFALQLHRHGRMEEAHFAFAYAPVRDDSGHVGGLFGTCIETTAQIRAIREVAQSKERLQLALSGGGGIGTWDWDIKNDRVVADERFASLYGVDPERARAGAPVAAFFNAIHPDDRERVQNKIADIMQTGEDFSEEYRLVQPDGTVRWVVALGRCHLDEDGAPARLPGASFDITDRKNAEAQLRHLNAELERKVIERTQARGRTWQVSPDLMGALNAKGYFETSNPAWRTVLGWSEEEVASTSIFELLHPDDVERTRAGFILTQHGHPAIQFPNRYRCKDGSYRWISWVGVPEDGMVYCTGRDITTERALQDSEVQFRTMAQAMPNHVWTAPVDGLLDWFNDRVYDYSGAPPGSLDGLGWAEIVHPEDLPVTGARWSEALATGNIYEAEFRLRRADGSYRWHITRAVPIRDASGHVVRWIGTNTDIQDQKETAVALADLNATLEQRVQERSSQLSQAEDALRQAQKMEAVGQLTGGIAHDFNNLLQGIIGALDRVERRIAQGRTDDLDRFLKGATASAKRAATMTQRLLAFSRRQTLAPKPVDLDALIEDVVDLARHSVGPNIEMKVKGGGGWQTLADPNQLENVLLNLCINARDAMPNGGTITIETVNTPLDAVSAARHSLAPGDYIRLGIGDTGTGMSADVMARAFDPFFTTKPLGQGTGLGLSMIYGFAQQSGGHVHLTSQVGKGTTVHLYLPRYRGTVIAAERPPLPTNAAGRGETILVVDDEVIIRMMVVDAIQEAGYAAIEAGDGAAGLKVLQSDARIDLLVTDVGLPGGLNGRQLADAALLKRPGLRVLFITGYAEKSIIGEGDLELGMDILPKPFVLEELIAKIQRMVRPN
jgi:PAS domain S-box-containing protein